MPLTYIPNCPFNMVFKAFREIEQNGPLTTDKLAKALQYSERTTQNIVTDISTMLLSQKNNDGACILEAGVQSESLHNRIRSQFEDHIGYRELIGSSILRKPIKKEEGIALIRKIYSTEDAKPKTRDNYFTRLIPWLKYAGHIEVDGNEVEVYPPNEKSPSFGQISTTTWFPA